MKPIKIIILLFCLINQHGIAQNIIQPASDTETRRISSGFHTIVVSSGITADIFKGNNDRVVVKASKADYRNKIKTVVVNDTLKIFFYYKDDPNWKPLVGSKEMFNVSIYASYINSIKITEGAVVNSHDVINADQLIVQLLKAGEFTANIICNRLFVNIKDSSHLRLSGNAETTTVKAAGEGYFDARKLITAECEAEADRSSNLYLNVTGKLNALAVNHSKILYKGNPDVVKKEIRNGIVKRY